MIKRILIISVLLLIAQFPLSAQQLNTQEVESFTEECHDLIAYLEFTLNSIGENDLTPKEKDIIISESYTKFFRDAKVQIEDDLVPDREAVTNKDVQAYLKDIDFFFTNVIFSFKILSVNLLQDENNEAFFKIQTLRTLSGNTINADSIQNEQVRYIEVAINPDLRDLKIVSIYTTKIDETLENINWWNNLPISWKEILGENIIFCDSLKFSRVLNIQDDYALLNLIEVADSIAIEESGCGDSGEEFQEYELDTVSFLDGDHGLRNKYQVENAISKITAIKELDLANRLDIVYLFPLSKLSALQSLDISGTLVNDIYPIRNLVDLKDLNISNTQIANLDALIYSMSLQNLNISNTRIHSITPLSNLSNLNILNISNTNIDDIQALSALNTLRDIDMKFTMVSDLEPLKGLVSLNYLDIDNSPISEINAMASLVELKVLSCNNTMINSLLPLNNLNELKVLYCENTEIKSLKPLDRKPNLSKIYCDNTLLGKEIALAYMNQNPHVLVVYESRKLSQWYKDLDKNWNIIFNSYVSIDQENPTKEQLHELASITEIDIANNSDIESLEPLAQLQNLKKLNAKNTKIASVEPLYELRELDWLDISNTNISSISALENINSLAYLNASNTAINSIYPLRNSHGLRKLILESTKLKSISAINKLSGITDLNIDGSSVAEEQIETFIISNPKCNVLYQSERLTDWWNDLNATWKQLFKIDQEWNNDPNKIQLHQLVKQKKLIINDNRNIKMLDPLRIYIFIEELTINGTQVSDVSVLGDFKRIKKLDLSQNPVLELSILSKLKSLESIKIANTPIENLDWIEQLTHLQYLDISGTQIKKLKSLSSLYMLETLIAYNTRINSLSDLDELVSLRSLKIYNTKVSSKKVDKFKNTHVACEVDYF